METLSLVKQPLSECIICKHAFAETDEACETCGYPLKGTDHERETFMVLRSNREIDLEDLDKKIKNSGLYLKIIGGFTAVSGLISYYSMVADIRDVSTAYVNIVLGGIYFSLGLWSKQKPMAAIVTGFTIFILMTALNAFFAPMTLVAGIIWKIAIVIAFVKGIKSSIETEKIKKELYYL